MATVSGGGGDGDTADKRRAVPSSTSRRVLSSPHDRAQHRTVGLLQTKVSDESPLLLECLALWSAFDAEERLNGVRHVI